MKILSVNKIFCSFLLLCAAACVLQPVMADNGTITIAYRGSGGSYVGDTVVFDGRNTYWEYDPYKNHRPGSPVRRCTGQQPQRRCPGQGHLLR